MARDEHDREDLLAEATALVVRAELRLPGEAAPFVFGFRRDGCASVYFGPDAAFHFNVAGELRRAYLDGLLYKAERRQLVSLRRVRTADEVQLQRSELTAEQTAEALRSLSRRLNALAVALQASEYELIGQVPADSNAVLCFVAWLAQLPLPPHIAASPHAK